MTGVTLRLDPAGREVLGQYRDQGPMTRLHLTLRWRTCPLQEIARHVPPAGRVLDLGCGHGLLTHLLALGHPDRILVGTDIDQDKLAHAVAATSASPTAGSVAFLPAYPDLPPDAWDAIVLADVLYLMTPQAQQRTLAACIDALAPSGVLLINGMGATPAWKARWARLQEHIAVNVGRWTAGDAITPVDYNEVAAGLRRNGLQVTTRDLSARYPHPHTLLIGQRPPNRER